MRDLMIIGREEDLCCKIVRKQLEERGRDVLWLPEDRLFPGMDFVWRVWEKDSGGFARYADRQAAFDNIDAVLGRFYGIAVTPEVYATRDGSYLCSEWSALATAWLSALPCRVINRLKPELWYKVKLNLPSLCALVPDLRFDIARTMITTRFEDCVAFYNRCDRRARYVPLTQTISYPLNNPDDLACLDKLTGTLPIQLIEDVEGERVEAFVIGSKILAVGDDGKRRADVFTAVVSGCQDIAERLGLAFCKVTLKLNGRTAWCLEADRFPDFHSIPAEIQDEIGSELADLMMTGQRSDQT